LIRLRDTSEEVRAAVFQVLGDCLELDEIPINDRANIIEQGLEDRSELVQNACKRVILTKWLPACEDSPVVLLKALDVEQFTEVGVKVSRTLLEEFVARDPYYEPEIYDAIGALSISSVSKGKLLPEDVLYWKEQCAFFSSNSNGNGSNRKADICNKLIPSLSDFCKLIKATAPVPECIFATQQLLLLGQSLDFQDEFGRRHLVQTIRKSMDFSSNLSYSFNYF
jgi:hypothetical protein